jgi:hypothetical protein
MRRVNPAVGAFSGSSTMWLLGPRSSVQTLFLLGSKVSSTTLSGSVVIEAARGRAGGTAPGDYPDFVFRQAGGQRTVLAEIAVRVLLLGVGSAADNSLGMPRCGLAPMPEGSGLGEQAANVSSEMAAAIARFTRQGSLLRCMPTSVVLGACRWSALRELRLNR